MELSVLQSILLVIVAGLVPNDKYGLTFGLRWPVITSIVCGLIVGDMKTALYIGGTLNLMALGLAPIGGSSIPEYGVGTVIGIAVAVSTGGSIESGIAIAIPVSMLMVQFDVIAKVSNSFVVKRAQDYANKKEFKKMNSILLVGPVIMWLTGAIPVALTLFIGVDLVNSILNSMPYWFTHGLSVAAKLLPVVGIAILMNFMPTKKYFVAIVGGYFLFAYLGVDMLGIAMVGFIVSYIFYKFKLSNVQSVGGLEDE
jgi:PTS system mannose-specific IIC component